MALYTRYNPLKRFAKLLFQDRQFVESAEFNEVESIRDERERNIGDMVAGPISLREGGTVLINQMAGTVRITASRVWAGGYMHQVSDATLTNVPMSGTVVIGVAVAEVTITDADDPTLKGIVPNTESHGESLASRLRYDPIWALNGDPFYPIYTLVDGALQNEVLAPTNDGSELLVERHIDETHGSHIIDGFTVSSLGFDAGTSTQIFAIEAGVLRAQGRRVSRSVDSRYSRVENPDLLAVVGEVHSYPSGGIVVLNNGPIADVQVATVTKEVTRTITHQLSGGADALPDTPVYGIVSVKQDATTYSAGADFNLVADKVDWSAAGGEPAPGTTYTVVYRYTAVVAPATIARTSITLAGGVVGLPVTVQYRYKLPRVDVLAIDLNGAVIYLEGLSNRYTPQPPRIPTNLAPLARIDNQWGITPIITDVDQRKLTEADTRALLRAFLDMSDLLSQVLLERDIQERDPSSRRGSFVDPFASDNQRDLGIAQDAAVFDGFVQLPIEVIVQKVDIGAVPILLPYIAVPVANQPFRTGSQKINEFQSFAPLPAAFSLSPSVDRYNITNSSTKSAATASFSQVGIYEPSAVGTPRYGTIDHVTTSKTSSTKLVSSSTKEVEFMRQITVTFTAKGFGPGEEIDRVLFDGVSVAVGGTKVANSAGVVTGTFVIPPNIRSGTKDVRIFGKAGSSGTTSFTGSGTITTQVYRKTTHTLTTAFVVDPIAQSFKLAEGRILLGARFEFTTRGNPAKAVAIELRPMLNGYPTNETEAEGSIPGTFLLGDPDVVKDANWTILPFSVPTFINEGDEYAVALLTDDAVHSVAFAQLGDQSDPNNPRGFDKRRQEWIRENPAGGVAFVSSNSSTWVAKPEMDFTHQIMAAEFTSFTRTVAIGSFNLGQINAGGISDIIVLLIVEEPSEDTRLTLEMVRANGDVIAFEANSRLQLDSYLTEIVTIRMVLVGTQKLSPIVAPECQILWGRLKETATYVSEANVIDLSAGNVKVRTVLEVNTPGSSAIAVAVGNEGAFAPQTAISAISLGDGWVEREFLQTPYANPEARTKITITGTPANRPLARELRSRATGI